MAEENKPELIAQEFGRPLSPDQILTRTIQSRPDLQAPAAVLQAAILDMEKKHDRALAAKDKTIKNLKDKLSLRKTFKTAAINGVKMLSTPFYAAGRELAPIIKKLSYPLTGPLANHIHLRAFPEDHAEYHGYQNITDPYKKKGKISNSYSRSTKLTAKSYAIAAMAYGLFYTGSGAVTYLIESEEKKSLVQNHIIAEMNDIPCHPGIEYHELIGINICTSHLIDGFSYQSDERPDVEGDIEPQIVNRLLEVKEQEQVDGKTALLQQWLINYQNADTPAKDSNFNVTQEDIEARASLCWRSGDNTRCHASGIKTGQEELFKPPAQEAEPAAQ